MVTGASTADLAVILIDARKGVLTQTRRHAYLVSLLGIRHVVLAVNKMDLVGYVAERLRPRSSRDYRDVRRASSASTDVAADPDLGAARRQRHRAERDDTPWYDGPDAARASGDASTSTTTRCSGSRSACRCSGSTARTSTSAASPGMIAARRGAAGRRGRASCRRARASRVARIVTIDGDLDEAVAGQSVTLTLADEIDCQPRRRAGRRRRAARGRRPVRGHHRLDGATSRCCPAAPIC